MATFQPEKSINVYKRATGNVFRLTMGGDHLFFGGEDNGRSACNKDLRASARLIVVSDVSSCVAEAYVTLQDKVCQPCCVSRT